MGNLEAAGTATALVMEGMAKAATMTKTTVLKIDFRWSPISTKDKIHLSHRYESRKTQKTLERPKFCSALSESRSFVPQRVLGLLAAICRENENNFRSNNREIKRRKRNNNKKK